MRDVFDTVYFCVNLHRIPVFFVKVKTALTIRADDQMTSPFMDQQYILLNHEPDATVLSDGALI